MDKLTFIFNVSISMLEVCFVFWALTSIFNTKWSKLWTFFVFFTVSALTWYVFRNSPWYFKSVAIIVEYCLLAVFLLEGNNRTKLLVVLIMLLLIVLSEVVLFVISKVMGFSSNVLNPVEALYYVMAVASKLLYITLLGAIILIYNMRQNSYSNYVSLFAFCIIPILTGILILVLFSDINDKSELLEFALFAVMSFVGYILLINLYIARIERLNYESKYEFAQREIAIRRQSSEEANRILDYARRLNHDMKHQLNLIESLYKSKNPQKAKEIIDKLRSDIDESISAQDRGDVIVDILLADWKEKINEIDKNVSVKIVTHIPKPLSIDMADLSNIIGNTFSNALEACQRMNSDSEKYIHCSFWFEADQLVYQIENSTAQVARKAGNKYISEKENKHLHGIGLISVQQTIDKYGGILNIESNSDCFVLTASIHFD